MKHIKTETSEYHLDDHERYQGEFKSYHDNGSLFCHCFYVDDQLHGEFKTYRDNGELYIHCFYVDGKIHGEYKVYHNNGQIDIHCFYKNGKLHGEYEEYYKNGQLYEHGFYANDEDVTDKVESFVSDTLNITDEEKVILKLQLGISAL